MKDLKDYTPADAYFRGRLWWKCGVIRQTTGLSNVEASVTIVNAPCIITSLTTTTRQEDWTRIQEPGSYRVIIPASYIRREALWRGEEDRDRIYLTWGADGDIFTSDILYVSGLPFLLRIAELRNPLTLFSHFELTCNTIVTLGLRVFSDFKVPFSVYRPVETPEDILPEVREVFDALMQQILPQQG